MVMRLRRHEGGPEELKEIASFRGEGRGLRAYDAEGHDLGYFGPEQYEKIILGGAAARERTPEGDPPRREA
jgi:hypothetical protein